MPRRTTVNTKTAATIAPRFTFQEALEAFLTTCRVKNLSAATLKRYKYDIAHMAEQLNLTYLDEFTIVKYEMYLDTLLDSGAKPTSINSRMNSWRAFFNYCGKRFNFEVFEMPKMKTEETIKETYTEKELRLLLEKPKTDSWQEWRSWAMVNYFVSTGNRIRTVLNLKIKDIDFEANTIFLSTVKNRHQQIVPLSFHLKEALLTYLDTFEWEEEDYLFQNYEGGQLATKSAEDSIARYNFSRGVKKTSCHLFRHTFAKNFILNGGGAFQLQALLGHSTLDMTNHYCRIYGTDLTRNFNQYNPLENLMNS